METPKSDIKFARATTAPYDKAGKISEVAEEKTTLRPNSGTRKGFTPDRDSDGAELDENRYRQSVKKMDDNTRHFCHHYDPKIRKKACASSNCNCNSGKANFPDKLEVLKDQNIHLKTNKKDLEEQVKIIATKLKRQIRQLK